MDFWQQLQQLLSEAPGNAVYHLVTLFALQVTLALALSQWRRERRERQTPADDGLARRLALAAGALLLVRFILLLVSLLLAARGDRVLALGVLPPLEQAANTVTALLLVWALVRPPASLPRLPDVLVVLLLLLMGVMYAFFAQDWAGQAAAGLTYNGSSQSTVWGILQLVILGAGVVTLIWRRRPGWLLLLSPLALLLLAHAVQFWDYPELIPGTTEIPAWIRLGHLIALPLLAAIAYRHTLSHLLSSRPDTRPPEAQLANSLRLATGVLDATTWNATLSAATRMVAGLIPVPFVGLAVGEGERPDRLNVRTLLSQGQDRPATGLQAWDLVEKEPAPNTWALNLNDWPAFRLALEQAQPIELSPEGMGARQLHDLAQEMGWSAPGPLLILPLQVDGHSVGVLLLGAPAEKETWSPGMRALAPRLAGYLARALANVQTNEEVEQEAPPATLPPEQVSGRLIALEDERDRALAAVETLEGRLRQTEARLSEAQQQARNLAATVEVLEQARPEEERAALEAEIDALRASLIEAEEAMALAAAGEGELSTEWVMMAISRYSGELEEAQERISELEDTLARQEEAEAGELLTSLAQELRTPLTSIAGYTDLLLGETMGILGVKQQEFLQRVKANVERMGVLLEQIVQLAAHPGQQAKLTDVEPVPVPEVVEMAVNTVITQVRKKELRLNLALADEIPPLTGNRDALCQILIHLLHNAFQVSANRDEVTISAHADVVQTLGQGDDQATESFVHLTIQDRGGGIRPEDRSHVFDPQYRAENPLIAGVGDTGAGLSVAQTLVDAHGGRIWVDSEMGKGSTFTILLPAGQSGNGSGQTEDAPEAVAHEAGPS